MTRGTTWRGGGTTHRVVAAAAAVLLGALACLLVVAAPAAAHPSVAWSSPDEDARLDAPPDAVTISFGEDVEAPIGSIRVYDLDSERVDLDDARIIPGDPRTVTVSMPADLADGTYVIIWRAVGLEDGHLVIGQQSFRVGAAAPAAAVDLDVADAGGVGELAAPAVGAVTTVAVLVGAGGTMFALVLLPRRDERWAGARRRSTRVVRRAVLVTVIGSAAALPLAAAVRAGTWSAATDPAALGAVVAGTGGAATLLRAMVLLPLLSRSLLGVRLLVVSGWAVALVTLAFDGHVAGVVGAAAGLGHVGAAAAWAGGLLVLALVLPLAPEDDADGLVRLVGRFGTVALLCVGVAAVAGVASAAVLSPDVPASVTGTTWGGLLLDKTTLLAAALLVAAHTRFVVQPRLALARRAVPAGGAAGVTAPPGSDLTAPPGDDPTARSVLAEGDPDPRRSLRRNVAVEAVLVLAVMGAGGAMSGLDPTPPTQAPPTQEAPAPAPAAPEAPAQESPGQEAPARETPTGPTDGDCPDAPLVEGEQAHGEDCDEDATPA